MSFNFQTTRLLSLDFFRGVAILGVVTVHLVIIGIFFTVDNALNILPTGVLAVFTPLIIFAPMAGLFAFISALANGLTVQKRLAKGYSIRSSIQPIFVTAMALLIIHFIYIAFFKEQMPTIFDPGKNPGGLFPVLLITGQWNGFTLDHFLMIDAFGMIMEATFFILILSYFLFKPNGKKSIKWKLNFLLIFGIVWTCLSPFLWGLSLYAMEFFYFQENIYFRLPSVVLSFFAGKMHPITTIAPFAIFGLWFAVFLFQSPDYSLLKRTSNRIAGAMAVLAALSIGFKAFLCFAKNTALYRLLDAAGIVDMIALNTPAKLPQIDPRPSVIAGDLVNSILNFIVVPPEWVFIAMAIVFLVFPRFIKIFDYRTGAEKESLARKIAPIRRFGTLSLTIFFFECLVQTCFSQFFRSFLIPRMAQSDFFRFLFEAPFYIAPKERIAVFDDFMAMWPLWILYLASAIGFWFLILYLWKRKGYKGSLEWWIAKLTGGFRKIKSDKLTAAIGTSVYREK